MLRTPTALGIKTGQELVTYINKGTGEWSLQCAAYHIYDHTDVVY